MSKKLLQFAAVMAVVFFMANWAPADITTGLRFYASFDSGLNADLNTGGSTTPLYTSGVANGIGKTGGGATLDGQLGTGLIYETWTDASTTVFDEVPLYPDRKWTIAYWYKDVSNLYGGPIGHFYIHDNKSLFAYRDTGIRMKMETTFMRPNYVAWANIRLGVYSQDASKANADWHHVVLTFDGALDPDTDNHPAVDRLYIDGTLTIGGDYDSGDNGFRQRADQLNRLILGNATDPNTDNVAWQDNAGRNGTFDEFRIYDRPLSTVDVTELYNFVVPASATIELLVLGLSFVFLRRRR